MPEAGEDGASMMKAEFLGNLNATYRALADTSMSDTVSENIEIERLAMIAEMERRWETGSALTFYVATSEAGNDVIVSSSRAAPGRNERG